MGILVGSTSEEIAAHIKDSWANGQIAVGMLQESLGAEADDLPCPPKQRGGGLCYTNYKGSCTTSVIFIFITRGHGNWMTTCNSR